MGEVMAEAVPETIDKATKALPVVSQNFAVVVAVIALAACCLLVWRDEVRADAQIKVLESMATRLGGVEMEARAQHTAFVAAGIRIKTVTPAVAREE